MTLDKSLKVRRGSNKARNVLTRGERMARLKAADRWNDGDDPFGLPKVRVYKLAMKKKKKKKEEGEEGTAAAPAAAGAKGAAAKAPAAKAPAAKAPAAKGGKK
jgi:small basic protein (TIGR04137 family)